MHDNKSHQARVKHIEVVWCYGTVFKHWNINNKKYGSITVRVCL
jgi:hypothetical protein